MIRTLVLLGATGDLARRFLFPALGALDSAHLLPSGFRVVACARDALDESAFRSRIGDALPSTALSYRAVDLSDATSLAAAIGEMHEPVAVYLALPPSVFATAIVSLGRTELPPGSAIAIEKPFGENEDSARALNELLAALDVDAYRVDHVLGMETTQNLVAMRRHSPFLDRLWCSAAVERVDIQWEETLALEGRAGYYDRSGALKDVLQNHMLQLLALVAMDLPASDEDVRRNKLEALRATRATAGGRRGRYAAGLLADGRRVPAYVDERGVDPSRGTETFVEVDFEVATPRWTGTPFVLRAGKALARRSKGVRLGFRGGGSIEIGIDGPDDVEVRLLGTGTDPIVLEAPTPGRGLPAYAHVLADVLAGTQRLSVSGDEAEQAWRIVTPILAEWKGGDCPIEEYRAGTTPDGRNDAAAGNVS